MGGEKKELGGKGGGGKQDAPAKKINCAWAVGRGRAISCGTARAGPINGSVACVTASMSASMSAICPISGIMFGAQASLPAERRHPAGSYFDNVLAASFAEFFTFCMSFAWSKARAASGGM